MLDLKTTSTIATSIGHAKLDYCNSLILNIDVTHANKLPPSYSECPGGSLACAVTKTPKHYHIIPVLETLHALTQNT